MIMEAGTNLNAGPFFVGFRPILDAMKSFAKDENPIDIEVQACQTWAYPV